MERKDGTPAAADQVLLRHHVLPIDRWLRHVANARVRPDGTFRFPAVAPGRYQVPLTWRTERGVHPVEIKQAETTTVELVAP